MDDLVTPNRPNSWMVLLENPTISGDTPQDWKPPKSFLFRLVQGTLNQETPGIPRSFLRNHPDEIGGTTGSFMWEALFWDVSKASGKRVHNCRTSPCYSWVNKLYLYYIYICSCSMAFRMFVIGWNNQNKVYPCRVSNGSTDPIVQHILCLKIVSLSIYVYLHMYIYIYIL